ncbi:MAG: GIY-YIG nuclease family protein, partial [Clostridia bacterium]|nr:GIY-YIG nuclease family protein [Clostridia bacterium]
MKQKIKNLPTEPGVYLMKDKANNVIYVGKAKNLKNRVSQYFLRNQEILKVRKMVENIVDF